MTRLAVYSRSDATHRELAAAARTDPAVRIDLRLRAERELGGTANLDALIIDAESRAEVDLLVERAAPLPIVVARAGRFSERELAAWRGAAYGWAAVSGSDPERLLAAARAAAAGFRVGEHDPANDAHATAPGADAGDIAADGPPPAAIVLSSREREVLELLVRGRTNAAIAASLGVSPNTVKYHLAGLYAKLDASTRSEAIWQASRAGLVSM